MVRLKSLVEATRVLVVEVMSKPPEIEEDGAEGSEMEVDEVDLDEESTLVEGSNSMDVARVYAGTVIELGMLLPSDTVLDAASC